MATQCRYLITNGDLGTFDNSIVYYSLHPNGRRALIRTIQEHANRTKKESWAYPWPDSISGVNEKNRYYVRTPE